MADFKIIMAAEYKHIETGKVFILVEADLSDDDDSYHRVELYKGSIEELNENNFREVWDGSISEFKKEWVLK